MEKPSGPVAQKVNSHRPDATASLRLRSIVEKIQNPQGRVSLQSEDRRYIVAVILASVVSIDGKVRQVEIDKLHEVLNLQVGATSKTLGQAVSIAHMNFGKSDVIEKIARVLVELLSVADRIALVGMLWDLALVDLELHKLEEDYIYRVADYASVPRRKVVEMEAKAAAKIQWRQK